MRRATAYWGETAATLLHIHKRLQGGWEAEIAARGGKTYGARFAAILFVVCAVAQLLLTHFSEGNLAMKAALGVLLIIIGLGLVFTGAMVLFRVGEESRKRELALHAEASAEEQKSALIAAYRKLAEEFIDVGSWNYDEVRYFDIEPKRNVTAIIVSLPKDEDPAKGFQVTRKKLARYVIGLGREEWRVQPERTEEGEWVSYRYNDDPAPNRMFDENHELEYTSNEWAIPSLLRVRVEPEGTSSVTDLMTDWANTTF